MQLLNELDQLRAKARRAKDMSIQEITRSVDIYTAYGQTVFPGQEGPTFLAFLKSQAESWLIFALRGRRNMKLATDVIHMIFTIESFQAGWIAVAEAKYLDTRGYPLVAGEGGQTYGLDDLEVPESGSGGTAAPTGTTKPK